MLFIPVSFRLIEIPFVPQKEEKEQVMCAMKNVNIRKSNREMIG